ncbi:thiol peroxidase [Secundilactobacillus oryzae JCM 18671]|uniref:Thiol peroxidase n=1 Tax=Secundilactobacillus oryzae JCM 18671 TaxID=1291743 RepID=A0A081BIR0_9LACO|nr:thiol peroxidase [Secundilactobacillus oryzae]GAK47928.1 thiol peroxidase [Secundilactobacillus oryzae JCM 18671]
MKVTDNGEPVELSGTPPEVSEKLPKFKVFNENGEKIKMASLLGKPLVISVVPDINTRVCSIQTRKFNQQADHYPDATFVTISNNTIKEQEAWCAVEGVDNMAVLSDEELSFGYAMGLYVTVNGTLARATFVTDSEGTITYREIVPELHQEPDYLKALDAVEKLTPRVDEA